MKGMTLAEMTNACHGIYHGDSSLLGRTVSSITTDSRTVKQDSLFIAIKGERVDGHKFIAGCFDAGALCCISEMELPEETHPYIQVESTLQALKDLAELYRGNLNVKVIGVTGSVGKTSTKETIAAVLSTKYKVLKTQGNFNNEIGLPLTIFRLQEDDEIAVLEMGISDFGEMSRLAKIARPDICVITNIGLCHLEMLKSRDGILAAKTEIFEYMNPDGVVILNGDDDKLVTVKQVHGNKPCFYGIENKDNIFAENVENLGLLGMRCTMKNVQTADGITDFKTDIPVPGFHMVYNAMAAAAVGAELGLTSDEIVNGLANMKTIAGRNNIIKSDAFVIIDDCYNANPVSMKASIDVLDSAMGRKVCILGDMFELGDNAGQLHREVGGYLGSKSIDVLIVAGELAESIACGTKEYISSHNDAYDCTVYVYPDRDTMLKNLINILRKGDNILVKASHGMEFSKVVEELQDMELSVGE